VLTEAVKQLLATGPLSKRTILDQVAAEGLQLRDKPTEVLNSIIYCRHNFIRAGRLFILAQPEK